MTIDFEDKPDVSYKPNQFANKEFTAVASEIKKLLAKGIIKISSHEEGEIVSPIFLREKPDGCHRLILNLKETNKFAENFHFKMETITTILSLVRPNCYMGTIDIKDAYYSVPVCEEDQKYLKFILMVNFSNSPVFQLGFVLGQGNLPNFLRDHLPLLEK